MLSTGDEVVEPTRIPGPGQIRNSNAAMLLGQIARAGAQQQYLGIARDTAESLRELITGGLKADVLLLSGGVSAGKFDLVPGVLKELGVQPIFHQVAMKPGKPLYFGVRGETLVFGLPGNPVSSMVGFELFVRPALRVAMGRSDPGPRQVAAQLTMDYRYKSDRPTYHPARLQSAEAGWQVTPVPWFGSPDLRAITQANAFAIFVAGERQYRCGEIVQVLAPEMDD
jgi:molybdopterin molybdotransferase